MKRILTTLKLKWPEYLLETLVIVIGIYGAFALENWNDKKKISEKEVLLIQEINTEFLKNKKQLEQVIEHHQKGYYSTSWLLKLMPFTTSTSKDSVNIHFRNTFSTWTFNPSQASINALSNAGDFDIINNRELRTLLIGWNDVVIDYQEEEKLALDFHFGPYLAYWRSQVDLNQVFNTSDFDYEAFNTIMAKNLILQRNVNFDGILNEFEMKEMIRMLDLIIELSDPINSDK